MLVAWLMLGLAMTACSDNNPTLDDATINQVVVNSQRPDTPKTYQLTVNATKDEGITRALTLSGSSINASWETTDIVLVYRSGSETSIGTLKPESSGEATMLSGEVTTSGLTVGEELTLKFLSPDYKTQDGTLASIATKCDYATATIKIFAIDGEDKIMTEGAVFENQQSIVHFNFTDLVTNSDIKLKKFTISSTSLDSSISVELANEASEAYVAIPISTNDLVLYFDAKSEVNKIRYQGIKTASNLTNGKFYQANVKLDTPLTLEATNNNNTSTILIDNLLHKKIKYSVNGNDLQTSEDNSITITVNANDKVQFFGNNSSYAGDLKFSSCTFDFYIYGNVMSLIDESNYPELKEVNAKAFSRLFQMNSNIKNHPSKKLRLPATTLAAGCYSEMFYGTGLTTAPELPAETLANDCYS